MPDCPHRKSTGLSILGRINSIAYALQGLLFALKTQANFRTHGVVATAVIVLGSRKLSERAGRWLKLLSGVIMLALASVMMLRPEWLT